jgi:hypothetical protein
VDGEGCQNPNYLLIFSMETGFHRKKEDGRFRAVQEVQGNKPMKAKGGRLGWRYGGRGSVSDGLLRGTKSVTAYCPSKRELSFGVRKLTIGV